MYFDFEDHRPDTPRVPPSLSVREGILLSLVFHLCLVIALLLNPDLLSSDRSVEEAALLERNQSQPPLRFVEVMPLIDQSAPPIRPADESDMDRRSATLERAPVPDNSNPFMRGNTPERIDGGPVTPPAGAPPAAPAVAESTPLPLDDAGRRAAEAAAAAAAQVASRTLTDSLRNPLQYLRNERFDNVRGGDTSQSADIQFDSMGVDFGPWLRRFKNQVERNWLVPSVAMTFKGRVVIQFHVLRNGTITDLAVVRPASIAALTTSAANALKLSNPTAQLPTEYPAEKVFFTVTFHYNEDPRTLP
jgi:TonB family protein